MTAQAEWETIREAFRTRDEVTLLALVAAPKRKRFARLLVKYDFLPGCALAEMQLERLLTLDEMAATYNFLKAIE